jgi:hypothetical protein
VRCFWQCIPGNSNLLVHPRTQKSKFLNESDHEWAKEQWAQAPVPMLTCEPVLAEAVYLLREHAGLPGGKVLTLFERKVIRLVAPE